MPMFLTKPEIKELTDKMTYSAQCRALNRLGIQHKTRADGSVVILRAHAEKEFGGDLTKPPKSRRIEPNFDSVT